MLLCRRDGGLRNDNTQTEHHRDERDQPLRGFVPCHCVGLGPELAVHGVSFLPRVAVPVWPEGLLLGGKGAAGGQGYGPRSTMRHHYRASL